jgi:hypothetical protein
MGPVRGTTHRALGICAGVALGTAAGWAWPQVVACGWLATLTAAGGVSPDVDQHRAWGLLDRFVPDEWLGNHGPLQHRGIAHWWALPVAGALAVRYWLPGRFSWVAFALLAGWMSHLAGDFLFGRPGAGRGPGIPFAPWWNHRGLGLAVGGWLERIVGVLLPFLVLLQGALVLRGLRV